MLSLVARQHFQRHSIQLLSKASENKLGQRLLHAIQHLGPRCPLISSSTHLWCEDQFETLSQHFEARLLSPVWREIVTISPAL